MFPYVTYNNKLTKQLFYSHYEVLYYLLMLLQRIQVSCGLCNLAVECWRSCPHSRLTALRVKETANKLLKQYKDSQSASANDVEPCLA